MKTSEFIETYSDDIIYLNEMREAILTHPFKSPMQVLYDASFSRIYCIIMIGGIEAMIKEWSVYNTILLGYFDKKKRYDNYSKVEFLHTAFLENGIKADKEILKDYLAIIYLRNTIVHSGWNENQKEFILERDFPIDSRNLNNTHLEKMDSVNKNMILYISMLTFVKNNESNKDNKLNEDTIRMDENLPEVDNVIRKKQLPKLFLNNFMKIKARLDTSRVDFQGQESEDLISLAEEALFFWAEYKRYMPIGELTSNQSIIKSLNILKDLLQKECFLNISLPSENIKHLYNNRQQFSEEQLKTLFNGEIKHSAKDIFKAIIVGELIYNTLPNISVLRMFTFHLPTIIPDQKKDFLKQAKEVLTQFELSRYYYHYIEKSTNNIDLISTIQNLEDEVGKLEASLA